MQNLVCRSNHAMWTLVFVMQNFDCPSLLIQQLPALTLSRLCCTQ